MKKLSSMKFGKSCIVCKHIIKMRDITTKLKSLEVDMFALVLVHFILNSLSVEYDLFKISYKTHKEYWSINKSLTMCVQEKETPKYEISESNNLITNGKKKYKKKKEKSIFMK